MQQNATPFRWTTRREQAAGLVAAGVLGDEAIAQQAGIGRPQLWRWRQHPEFAARVDALVAEQRAAVAAQGIADRQNRVAAQDDRWRRMQALMAARATAYQDGPGGETGLIVMQHKALGYGRSQEIVEEYVLDAALLAELRKLEEHTAKELGQWTEKHDHSGTVVIREYGGFDPEAV